ncbi:hypothetical protein ETD86_39235 [Nonomuraea turkmeniaca]|uniref:Uncharacterized protein n=1 Tax=Nonomuraea turkmeniaca TaxID=103838 RepID=A0A5S4F3K1_9ACTN|nr:hypothetical protein [Nonomuraea turkmeniaca]TMR10490.1 hypothetical protein ETD86_39235 [Nonomuraea turkmeniaca]
MPTLGKTLPAMAALGVSALFLAAPQTAYAADSISCVAVGQTHFTPGVQMFPQSEIVTYQGVKSTCIDHSDMGITSARITASFGDVDLSCVASDFGTGTGTAAIEWDMNGSKQTSKADIAIAETVLNTARVTGVVTEGPFAGRRFTGKFDTSLLKGTGKCSAGALFGGVKSADFKGSFSIG